MLGRGNLVEGRHAVPGRGGGAWCLWEERAGDGHSSPEWGGAGAE